MKFEDLIRACDPSPAPLASPPADMLVEARFLLLMMVHMDEFTLFPSGFKAFDAHEAGVAPRFAVCDPLHHQFPPTIGQQTWHDETK